MGSKVIEVLVLSLLSATLIWGQQIPCIFTFGDSEFDNGNSNFVNTPAKANFKPNGIDYPDGPTGRFCNGKLMPDFLAEYLGFEKHQRSFASAKAHDFRKGVNYACAAAGILDDSGANVGERMSMRQQLLNHEVSISNISNLIGNMTSAKEHLNKCLYLVNFGINDYLNNYLLPKHYETYSPPEFAAFLTRQYYKKLSSLYYYGARKIAVYGLGAIGCAPQFLTNGTICNQRINNVSRHFNDRLKPLVDALNSDLDGAQFTMINLTSITSGDPAALGIKVTNASCCAVSQISGLCVPGKEPCANRNEYYFWDNLHVSEIVNRVAAARSYNSQLPTDTYPFDIHTLLKQ